MSAKNRFHLAEKGLRRFKKDYAMVYVPTTKGDRPIGFQILSEKSNGNISTTIRGRNRFGKMVTVELSLDHKGESYIEYD